MNIHVEARSYTDAGEMLSTYAEARKRLFGRPPVIAPEPVPEIPDIHIPDPEPEMPAVYLLAVLLLACARANKPVEAVTSLPIHEIKRAVCLEFKVSHTELVAHRRDHGIIWPRHIAVALAKHLTGESLPLIGREFGGRDHTTILHTVRKMRPHIEAVTPFMAADATAAEWVAAMRLQVEAQK